MSDLTTDIIGSGSPEYAVGGTTPNTIDSTEITLAAGVADGDANLEVLDQQQDYVSFNTSALDGTDMTSTVFVNTSYVPPSSDPNAMDVQYQMYKYAPQMVQYNGSSLLQYQVEGTAYSYTLTNFAQEALGRLHTLRNLAAQQGDGAILPEKHSMAANTLSTPSLKRKSETDLVSMTDQEIKKWLKDKGYKVKLLGNRLFKLTLKVGKSHRKLYVHSIFDAKTAEMKPVGFSRKYKPLSKVLVKRQNGKRTEITRLNNSMFKEKGKKLYIKMKNKNF